MLYGHGQPLFRGKSAQSHVWALVIVGPHPLSSGALNVVQVVPVILGQPLVAYGSVEPLHIGILLRLAWLDVFKLNIPGASPLDDRCTQVFWAVVAANSRRLSPPSDNLLERADHALGR